MQRAPRSCGSRLSADLSELRQLSVASRRRPIAFGALRQASLTCLLLVTIVGGASRVHRRLDWKFTLLSIPLRSDARAADVDDNLQLVSIPGAPEQARSVEFDDSASGLTPAGCDEVFRDLFWGDPAVVHLPYCELTDAHVAIISQAPTLRSLILDGTRITDTGIQQLRPLQQLEYLSLGGTAISDKSLDIVGRFPELRFLNLSETRISNRALEHLTHLRRLEILNLTRTAIDPRGLTDLQAMSKLVSLRLDDVPLDDESVAGLCTIRSLNVLSLRRTGITRSHLAQLAACLSLDQCIVDSGILCRHDLDALVSPAADPTGP
jgi:hypothetical protein